VEDDPGILALAKHLLETLGLRVLPAASGEEGLELWLSHRNEIELLFTDIMLPGALSGRDLALEILSQSPSLPVLYTSGYSSIENDQAYLTADNFLQKPFPPDAIERAVKLALTRT
jgi:CheY-like chemotaxis protein